MVVQVFTGVLGSIGWVVVVKLMDQKGGDGARVLIAE